MAILEEQTKDFNHYRLHLINTKKFKTLSLIVQLKKPLTEESVTSRAILPYVLQSATESLRSVKEVRAYLDELYGATLSADLSKKGDNHIITFRVDVAQRQFLFEGDQVLEKAIQLLADVLFKPKGISEKAFDEEVVTNEKRSLKRKIAAIYDDKMRYANMRLIQEMFEDEPFSQTVYGNLEEVDKITSRSLFHDYEQIIREDDIDVYVVGNLENENIEAIIQEHFVFPQERRLTDIENPTTSVIKKKRDVKEEIEEQDINQGKLNIGYRTFTTFNDNDYSALQVFNGIFGGYSHSKLFLNVREKESLAYYAASRMESHKGILVVMSGIDSINYDKAVKIINEQMNKMKQGDFTESELNQTKIMLKNQILEAMDDPRGIMDLLYNQVVANSSMTIHDMLHGIESVTREDVKTVAEKIQLDTIYFLKGKEE